MSNRVGALTSVRAPHTGSPGPGSDTLSDLLDNSGQVTTFLSLDRK